MNLHPIPSRPGYYASDEGHIYSTRNRWRTSEPRQLAEYPTHDGYLRVRPYRSDLGRVQDVAVAVLVAEAFHGPRPAGLQVRHLDGVNQNNRPENLRYGTAKENAADRDRHGHTRRGVANNKVRHTAEEVRAAVERVRAGERQAHVAASLGVSDSTIARWRTGACRPDAAIKTWRAA